jgi:hypothetical protein
LRNCRRFIPASQCARVSGSNRHANTLAGESGVGRRSGDAENGTAAHALGE